MEYEQLQEFSNLVQSGGNRYKFNITTEEFLAMIDFEQSSNYSASTQNQNTSFISTPFTTVTSSPNDSAANLQMIVNASGIDENSTILSNTYPSGYTVTHIVIASVIVTILMIIIVVGNMLVIIAIATEKSLKNIQNWFIASLAVADFFLGLVIMPFSLANELMGYWTFGTWWCDIHSAMDVLLCTASIMNLCLISLDRYWSITKAVEYLKSRTPARAALMIAAVWIMSGLICIPPLLGWKVKRPEGQLLPQCQLSEDLGYVVYSALGSFYIPSCIMVFVYIRIYFAAKARARRGIKKQIRKPASDQITSFTTHPNKSGTHPMPTVPSTSSATASEPKKVNNNQQAATIECIPSTQCQQQVPIPIVTCDFASDVSTSEAADSEPPQRKSISYNENLKVSSLSVLSHSPQAVTLTGPNILTNHQRENVFASIATNGRTSNELQVSTLPTIRSRALSVGTDTDMVSEFDPSSSDSGIVSRCAVVKPLKFRLCQPIFGRKANLRRNESKSALAAAKKSSNDVDGSNTSGNGSGCKAPDTQLASATELESVIPKIQKPRDPEKEKRRIARKKEKRATLILGLIMGSFIACWLPFFFLYILTPACSDCNIPDAAFAVAFWLGYMNSALNPAIYTIFNKDFRRAFRRILFK